MNLSTVLEVQYSVNCLPLPTWLSPDLGCLYPCFPMSGQETTTILPEWYTPRSSEQFCHLPHVLSTVYQSPWYKFTLKCYYICTFLWSDGLSRSDLVSNDLITWLLNHTVLVLFIVLFSHMVLSELQCCKCSFFKGLCCLVLEYHYCIVLPVLKKVTLSILVIIGKP